MRCPPRRRPGVSGAAAAVERLMVAAKDGRVRPELRQGRPERAAPGRPEMDIRMLIDGADTASAAQASFERLNPVTGAVATRAPAAGRADVDRAVEAAAAAFPAWAETGPNARRAILLKAADALEARTRRIRRRDDGGDRRDRPLDRLQRDVRGQHAARGGGDDHADHRARSSPPTSPARWPWRCASRSACWSAWRPGTRR